MPCPCLLIDCNDSKNEIFNCIVKITPKKCICGCDLGNQPFLYTHDDVKKGHLRVT